MPKSKKNTRRSSNVMQKVGRMKNCPHQDYRTPTGLRLQVYSRITLKFWLSG